MKTKLAILLILLFAILLSAETSIFDIKAPFREATIYLKNEGTSKGNKVIYVKDWGKTMATYTNLETKMFGITKKQKTLELTTPEWIYHIDFIKKTGTKSHNPVLFVKEEYEKLSKADKKKFQKNAKSISMNMITSFNGKVTENATKILGYNCDKTEVMGSVIYNIHNSPITLKMNSNIMGIKSSLEAIKIEKGKVDGKKFDLPKGMELKYNKEADEQAKQMAISMVHSIVEGKTGFEEQPIKKNMPKDSEKRDINSTDQEDFKKAIKGLQNLFGN